MSYSMKNNESQRDAIFFINNTFPGRTKNIKISIEDTWLCCIYRNVSIHEFISLSQNNLSNDEKIYFS